MNNLISMPSRMDLGREYDYSIDMLYRNYNKSKTPSESEYDIQETVDAERYVCGYPVPPFQRELCWSVTQEINFITSAWMGVYIGVYICHDVDWDINDNICDFSGWIIDGQQRLTAFENYWNDKFKINGRYWSELLIREKRRFLHLKFTHRKVNMGNEKLIRDMYNQLNFGGVNHRDDERA